MGGDGPPNLLLHANTKRMPCGTGSLRPWRSAIG
jgi:hypothetical protein